MAPVGRSQAPISESKRDHSLLDQNMKPIPENIIVDRVLLVIVKLQAYKQEYKQFKPLPGQDFAKVQIHFKAAKRLWKKYQDTAEEHGYGMLAEDAAQDGMTKIMLNLANAMNRNETANAGIELANVTDAALQEIRDRILIMQQ